MSVKEVKFRPKIGRGDFDTKVRKVDQFIDEGHKVKVTLQFRGREMAHPELGSKILDEVLDAVGRYAKVETQARLEGRNMSMVLSPDKKALDRQGRRRRAPPPAPTARRRATPTATTGTSRRPRPPTRSDTGVEPKPPSRRRPEHDDSLTPSSPLRREHHTMPKMKTSKTAAKRFKTTGTGQAPPRSRRCASTCSRRSRRRAPAASPAMPTCTRPTLKKIKRLLGER